MQEYVKLREWAKKREIHYNTAYRWFHNNLIDGAYQEPITKSIFVKSIVTSFCGRLYGANRKVKTREIIETIKTT